MTVASDGPRPCQKTKHPDNQRLMQILHDKREAQPANSNYRFTLKKAMDSIRDHKHPILNYQEALNLKNIGKVLAHMLFPTNSDNDERTTSQSVVRVSRRDEDEEQPRKKPRVATKRANQGTSAKGAAYEQAVAEARRLNQLALRSLQNHSNPVQYDWQIVLLVDQREQEKEHMQAKCLQASIPCEVRCLPIGDMTWIARGTPRATKGQGGVKAPPVVEFLLGTIIERKTLDDLVSSIHGTRYSEQRMRLKDSGLPQLLLLVEGDLRKSREGEKCHSAIWETRIHMGFQCVQTKNMMDTVNLLKRLHRRILQRTFPDAFYGETLPSFRSPDASAAYRRRRSTDRNSLDSLTLTEDMRLRRRRLRIQSLMGLTFDTDPVPPEGMDRFMTYNELKAKIECDRASTRTVGAIHGAMLRQIESISLKKVAAIVKEYPTPALLLAAYEDLNTEQEKEDMLRHLYTQDPEVSERTCKIGPQSSRNVYIAYGMSKEASRRRSYSELVEDVRKKQSLSQSSEASFSSVPSRAKAPPPTQAGTSGSLLSAIKEADERTTLSRLVEPPHSELRSQVDRLESSVKKSKEVICLDLSMTSEDDTPRKQSARDTSGRCASSNTSSSHSRTVPYATSKAAAWSSTLALSGGKQPWDSSSDDGSTLSDRPESEPRTKSMTTSKKEASSSALAPNSTTKQPWDCSSEDESAPASRANSTPPGRVVSGLGNVPASALTVDRSECLSNDSKSAPAVITTPYSALAPSLGHLPTSVSFKNRSEEVLEIDSDDDDNVDLDAKPRHTRTENRSFDQKENMRTAPSTMDAKTIARKPPPCPKKTYSSESSSDDEDDELLLGRKVFSKPQTRATLSASAATTTMDMGSRKPLPAAQEVIEID